MSIRKRFVWALLFAVFVLLASSCGSTQETPQAPTATVQPTATEPPAAAPTVDQAGAAVTTPSPSSVEVALQYIVRLDGTILARVNGQDITWEDYEPGLRQALTVLGQQYQIDWSDPAMQMRLKSVQNDVLKQTVDRWLLRQLAEEQGVALDDTEFQTQLDSERTQIMDSGRYADWNEFLEENGLTDNSFEWLLRDTMLLNLMVSQQTVDTQGEQTHLRHIVVTDEATAQEIEAELKAGGDWSQLAAEYSIDEQTKDAAGDLGWFSAELMSPEIKPIADTLAPGEFSEPIVMQSGVAIIQVVERAVRELDQRMIRQRQQDALLAEIETLRAKADIEYLVDFGADATVTP
jgi:parvulin-like peptidyl-prolyl isomerase